MPDISTAPKERKNQQIKMRGSEQFRLSVPLYTFKLNCRLRMGVKVRIKSILVCIGLVLLGAAQGSASTVYTYDDLGRLSCVLYDNGMKINYSYDQAGNRTQVVTQGGTACP